MLGVATAVKSYPAVWLPLFWRRARDRTGRGATPDEAAMWAKRGKKATLRWILHGGHGPSMVGPAPTVDGCSGPFFEGSFEQADVDVHDG